MMNADSFPELPEVYSAEDFKRETSWLRRLPEFMRRRSDPLKDLDGHLAEYNHHYATFNGYRQECISSPTPTPAALKGLIVAYENGRESFTAAAGALAEAKESLDEWNQHPHPGRNKRDAVTRLSDQLHTGRQQIEAGRPVVERFLHEFGDLTPNTVHVAWLGGAPSAATVKRAQNWEASQGADARINVWVDSRNLLANSFKKATADLRKGREDYSAQNDPAVTARIDTWKGDRDYARGLDEILIEKDKSWQSKRDKYQAEIDELQRNGQPFGPQSRIRVRDVNELLAGGSTLARPDTEHALDSHDREQIGQLYQMQVGERCNLAAGADFVKVLTIHDEPGLAVDEDMMPPVKGFNSLVDAWNGSLKGDAGKLDAKKGVRLVEEDAYKHLMGAVEEHIERVRDGTTNALNKPRPAYESLTAHAQGLHKDGKFMQEFDAWTQRTHSLADAFEKVEPIYVAQHLFKAWQASHSEGIDSNAALAASHPGSYAVAELGREMVVQTGAFLEKEENKREFFLDTRDNRNAYKDATKWSTGPTLLTLNERMDEVFRSCGVSDSATATSPLLRIPRESFPNPSLAEGRTTWASSLSPSENNSSRPSIQQRSLRTQPSGSTQPEAQQRSLRTQPSGSVRQAQHREGSVHQSVDSSNSGSNRSRSAERSGHGRR